MRNGSRSSSHSERDEHDKSVDRRLDRGALLALQLLARGYSPEQIARLREVSVADVLRDLARAFRHFGVGTADEAIATARRRGLIL